MKLGTNIKHDRTTCRDEQHLLHLHFYRIIPLCNFLYRNRVHFITLIRFEIMSRNLAEIYSTYIFYRIIPLCNFQYRNRVRFITLLPFEIMSRNLTRRDAEINNGHSTYTFCGIIPFCNFQYKNRVHSITLIPFEIISQNLVEI